MLDRKKCGEIRDALLQKLVKISNFEAHFESFDFEGVELSLGSARFSDQIVTFKLECAMPKEDGTPKYDGRFLPPLKRVLLMDDEERKAFVDAMTLMGIDEHLAIKKFLDSYCSDEGAAKESHLACDNYTFLMDAIHIWEKAKDYFANPMRHQSGGTGSKPS